MKPLPLGHLGAKNQLAILSRTILQCGFIKNNFTMYIEFDLI
jgi:hypothetical protein